MSKGSSWILRLYFATISAITLITLMFGAIDLLSTGLKTYVFKAADVPDYLESCSGITVPQPSAPVVDGYMPPTKEQLVKDCETRNIYNWDSYRRMKASQAVRNVALILVSTPLFGIHFFFVYRDWIEEKKEKKSGKN